MSLGSQSTVVNGQRVDLPTSFQYTPTSYGVQTTGVPQISPTMPPYIGGAAGGGAMGGASEGVDGYGTAGGNQQATAIANANPHNLKVSPVWWAVGALLFGLTMLNVIHWRKTTLEGLDESGHIGGARESASESV